MTLGHDALDFNTQGPSAPSPHRDSPILSPSSDIWWSRLETFAQTCSLEDPRLTSGGDCSTFGGRAGGTGMLSCVMFLQLDCHKRF